MDREVYDLLYKLIIIGDSSVGKSNILTQYLNDKFDPNSKSTVGVEFGTKNVKIKNTKIKLQIWDTAGQERYRAITSAIYKGAKGALIVYDITNKNSFNNIDKWIADIKANGDKNVSIIIVGNKSDLNDKREVDKDEGIQKSETFKTAFMETSALTGDNVSQAFSKLVQQIFENKCSNSSEGDEPELDKGVNLSEKTEDQTSKCC